MAFAVQAFSCGMKEASADEQSDDTGEHQRFDNRCLARRQLTEPVMGFQLRKLQPELSAAGMDLGGRFSIEFVRGDIS